MNDVICNVPIIFLVFNRPGTTARVFEQIAKVRPPKLLIVADGPRANRPDDAVNCALVRKIFDKIDWPCEVYRDFSNTNLGCRQRVSSGLDWAFELVDSAVILEDDCLPSMSFFLFCQELLNKYRDDHRVLLISGDNFQLNREVTNDSYYFSKYVHIWGWATWRDRWRGGYDVDLKDWPEVRRQVIRGRVFGGLLETRHWTRIFDRVFSGEIGTWDYQLGYLNFLSRRVSIIPSKNLVQNIGFSGDATHTVGWSEFAHLVREEIWFPLIHPKNMVVNYQADRFTYWHMFERYSFAGLVRFLRRFFRL